MSAGEGGRLGRRRKCEAYKVFERNLERAKAFVRIFNDRRTGAGQPSNDDKELLRGAVVLAIAALDAFLHDLILEIVPVFGGNEPALEDALRAIAKDDPSLALRMSIAPDRADKAEYFRAALEKWLERKSFQGPERVAIALRYLGSGLTWDSLDEAAGRNAAARLEGFTRARHDIVHRGKRPYIVRSSADECIRLVEAIAKAVNDDAVGYYNGTKAGGPGA